MKILICGSSFFRKNKVEVRDKLLSMGHEAIIDPWTVELANDENPELWDEMQKEHAEAKKKYGFIKWYFDAIRDSDAILVCNYDKKGVGGYIGSNTLMEIAVAYDHDKKIYFLKEFDKGLYCYDEVASLDVSVVNKRLELIQ